MSLVFCRVWVELKGSMRGVIATNAMAARFFLDTLEINKLVDGDVVLPLFVLSR